MRFYFWLAASLLLFSAICGDRTEAAVFLAAMLIIGAMREKP